MNFKPLFVTGMFRSGTTLLAKILNAHPDIVLSSDPFLPFFKHLRDEIHAETANPKSISPQAPLDDYFADQAKLALFRAVQGATLDRPFSDSDRPWLWPVIKQRAADFSHNLVARMDELQGNTYRELYLDMLRLNRKVYGRGNEIYSGHKEVWADEFASVLQRDFPQQKCIHIVRDPRAMCASKNVADDKYPWLFLIRHWRKLASIGWYDSKFGPAKERTLLIRYEDLSAKPEIACKLICEFLELEFSASMLDPDNHKDGDNTPWKNNTSYSDQVSQREIENRSKDRWKTVLSGSEVELIEQLTFPMMDMFEYETVTNPSSKLPDHLLFNPPQVTKNQLTPWIREHVKVDKVSTVLQMQEESLRLRLLEKDGSNFDELRESMFFFQEFYEACCSY